MRHLGLSLTLLLVNFCARSAHALCPNRCSMHGDCDHYNRCNCWSGWAGADCSQRSCPLGTAWSDEASAVDVAHARVECSNRGTCNRTVGRCSCMPGFSGAACDRNECSRDGTCNGRGTCHSMQSYAEHYRSPLGKKFMYRTPWDAQNLHRCACDKGYSGHNCELRDCPLGDDPLTTGQVNEVQLVVCRALGGTWALVFDDERSASISAGANAAQVREAIMAIPSIADVAVTFRSNTNGAACGTTLTTEQVSLLPTSMRHNECGNCGD